MPGSTPPTSQLDWLSSTTAMIVLLWSRATRDLLKSFGWGIVALHRLNTATKLPSLRRPPHRIFESRFQKNGVPTRITASGLTLLGQRECHRHRSGNPLPSCGGSATNCSAGGIGLSPEAATSFSSAVAVN